MFRMRLCWENHVRLMKRETHSCTTWVIVDKEKADNLRFLCKAGNDRFGEGSHWIELADIPPAPAPKPHGPGRERAAPGRPRGEALAPPTDKAAQGVEDPQRERERRRFVNEQPDDTPKDQRISGWQPGSRQMS